MKSLFQALIVTCFLLFCPSCSWLTTQTNDLTPARMAQINSVTTVGSQIGALALLNKHPEYKNALGLASDALGAVAQGSDFSPDHVDAFLKQKLAGQLTTANANLIYDSVLTLVVSQYKVFWEQNTAKFANDKNWTFAVSFLTAAKKGIDQALAAPSAPTPKANPLQAAKPADLTI